MATAPSAVARDGDERAVGDGDERRPPAAGIESGDRQGDLADTGQQLGAAEPRAGPRPDRRAQGIRALRAPDDDGASAGVDRERRLAYAS